MIFPFASGPRGPAGAAGAAGAVGATGPTGPSGAGAAYPTAFVLENWEAVSSSVLLGTTSTSSSPVTHNLTMPGAHSRTVTITLSNNAGKFGGSLTVTGTIGGAAQSFTVTHSANGNETVETIGCFDPGALTVAWGANVAGGSYTIGIGTGFGLPAEADEVLVSGLYFGHGIQLLQALGTNGEFIPVDITFTGAGPAIVGPTDAHGRGALKFHNSAALDALSGVATIVSYAAAAA